MASVANLRSEVRIGWYRLVPVDIGLKTNHSFEEISPFRFVRVSGRFQTISKEFKACDADVRLQTKVKKLSMHIYVHPWLRLFPASAPSRGH
jgi:hypothetical protein